MMRLILALPKFPWLGSFFPAGKAQRGFAPRAIAGRNEPNHRNFGRALIFIALLTFSAASIVFSLFKGSTFISFQQLLHALLLPNDSLVTKIIFDLRMPRAFSAFVSGGLLALAGALMQVLLQNPLADPYVLGISGGAAVTSLLCMLCGMTGYWLTGGAWFGSLVTILLVFLLSNRKNAWQSHSILLTGIAVASGFAALISFILLISPDMDLRNMLFWLLGDLSYAHWPIVEAGILFIGLIISMGLGKQLNILMQGHLHAKALGIHTKRLQIQIYLLSSLLTASAVSLAGCIGFIGLIVPHLFRLVVGQDHRYLLPGCVLLGGSLLTIADTLSRTLFSPEQIPVGIVMALLGVPIFLILLQR